MAENDKKKPRYVGKYIKRSIPTIPTSLKNVQKYINVKQLSYDMGEIFRADANKYIPSRSGNLRENSYKIHTSNSKRNPWFVLQYKNTPDVPYAMYQYAGKVWRPNYAIFMPVGIASYKAYDLKIQYEHIGWASSKKHPRKPSNRPFRRRAAKKVLDKGKVIHYTGYSHRNCQPEWLDYTLKNSKGLGSWREEIPAYVKRVYRAALAEQDKDAAKKEAQKQARKLREQQRKLQAKPALNERFGLRKDIKLKVKVRKKKKD